MGRFWKTPTVTTICFAKAELPMRIRKSAINKSAFSFNLCSPWLSGNSCDLLFSSKLCICLLSPLRWWLHFRRCVFWLYTWLVSILVLDLISLSFSISIEQSSWSSTYSRFVIDDWMNIRKEEIRRGRNLGYECWIKNENLI